MTSKPESAECFVYITLPGQTEASRCIGGVDDSKRDIGRLPEAERPAARNELLRADSSELAYPCPLNCLTLTVVSLHAIRSEYSGACRVVGADPRVLRGGGRPIAQSSPSSRTNDDHVVCGRRSPNSDFGHACCLPYESAAGSLLPLRWDRAPRR